MSVRRMSYLIAGCTDQGIKKEVNQDAFLLKVARMDEENICFCVMADGMGGLSLGERASASVIRTFESWFEKDFPKTYRQNFFPEKLKEDWSELLKHENELLAQYARDREIRMGSTVAVLLVAGGKYYLAAVGDTRIYQLDHRLLLLTKDQTLRQTKLDQGYLTYEESLHDKSRSVLLQCVGASSKVVPDFSWGKAERKQTFLICSDGFWHLLKADELYRAFCPKKLQDERKMRKSAFSLIEQVKNRGETDNISVALVRII